MGTRTSYEPGLFSGVELVTTDMDAAAGFYRSIFGWDDRDDHGYRLFSLPEGDVAGGYEQTDVPPHWNTYVTVKSADDTAELATQVGGSIAQFPVDAHTNGRVAGITDPGGATILVWEPKDRFGAEYVNEPGCWSWSELTTRDPVKAAAFYAQLFGWGYEEPDPDGSNDYRVIRLSDRQIGGIMSMPAEIPDEISPSWESYFNVDDLDATLTELKDAGGTVFSDVMEIPGVGRFCPCGDPQGASMVIIQGEAWDS